jgi:hypothetical protein
MSLWDSVKGAASNAGRASKIAAQKTKLRTDMVLIDRDMRNRKMAFGMTMYDHVSPLSQHADFYAATDPLTEILRPNLILAQKEIQALAGKRVKLKEAQAAAEAKRAGAFPTKAETWGGSFMNAGKVSVMHGSETKIKTELAIMDRKINAIKQTFGLNLFATLVEAEDTKGFLPTDRQVRSIYDQTRGEIQKLEVKKDNKMRELEALGGAPFEKESLNGASQSTLPENFNNDASHDTAGDLHLQHQDDGFSQNNNNINNNNAAGTQGQFQGSSGRGGGFSDIPPETQGQFQGGGANGGGFQDNPGQQRSSEEQMDDLLL